MVIFRNQQAK